MTKLNSAPNKQEASGNFAKPPEVPQMATQNSRTSKSKNRATWSSVGRDSSMQNNLSVKRVQPPVEEPVQPMIVNHVNQIDVPARQMVLRDQTFGKQKQGSFIDNRQTAQVRAEAYPEELVEPSPSQRLATAE